MAFLVHCEACGQEVSSEANACIHCGQPFKKRGYRAVLVRVIGIGILIGGAIFAWSFGSSGGLPSCESSEGQAYVKQAIENSPFAKTSGLTIVVMNDSKSIAATTEKIDCKAAVILNNSTKGVIDYSFTNDPSLGNGKYYVRAILESDSFRPYP